MHRTQPTIQLDRNAGQFAFNSPAAAGLPDHEVRGPIAEHASLDALSGLRTANAVGVSL